MQNQLRQSENVRKLKTATSFVFVKNRLREREFYFLRILLLLFRLEWFSCFLGKKDEKKI